jgi:hypothetical protein
MMKTNHTTTTALVVLAAIAATLLAAGTITVASNHSAFAWKNKEYKKDKYQRDENKYQYDRSDGKYSNGRSITVIAANEQSNECHTEGNNSAIGAGACVNTGTATATNSGGIIGEDAK